MSKYTNIVKRHDVRFMAIGSAVLFFLDMATYGSFLLCLAVFRLGSPVLMTSAGARPIKRSEK
jgi:hypothetical protein